MRLPNGAAEQHLQNKIDLTQSPALGAKPEHVTILQLHGLLCGQLLLSTAWARQVCAELADVCNTQHSSHQKAHEVLQARGIYTRRFL